MELETEKLSVRYEDGWWRLIPKGSTDDYCFRGTSKGLSALLTFARHRGWADRERVSGTLKLEKIFMDERGRCTITLEIEGNRIVVVEDPDWSSGLITRKFSKTIDSLAYALTFLQ